MKILVALLVAIPTLISLLLFTIAGFAYNNPAMLAATSNPAIAMLCVVSGVIATLPLVMAVIIGLGSLFGKAKNKENKNTEKENEK